MTLRRCGSASLAAYLVAMACEPSASQRNVGADSLLAPGESLYARGAFDSATSAWRAALDLPEVAGSSTEARLLHWLGLAAYRQGEYAEARRLGERSLNRKRELGLARADVAESQNALGLLAWSEGRLRDAGALLDEARRGFVADGDRAGVAKSSNNLALVSLELGRFAEARVGFETARNAAKAIGNARIEGRATTNLAMIALWTGDLNLAPPLLAESRRLADSASDPVGLENALGQLAVAWSALGDPGRALATLDSATVVARQHGLREAEANNRLVAASIYRDAGDAERAMQLYAQARAINGELELRVEEGMVLRHEAMLRASRGALERARADASQALVLHRDARARLEEFNDLLTLARIEEEAGDRRSADRRLTEARRVMADVDAPKTRVALGLAEARIADRRANASAALSALRRVSADLAMSGADASVEAEWLRTRSFASLGELDSAVAAGRRAVSATDRSRNSFGSPVLRASFIAERSRVFADLVMALLRIGEVEEAFAIADASRGRALIDHLSSAREATERSATGRDLAERDRLMRRIDALLERLEAVQTRPRQERGPDDDAASRELAERLSESRAEFEAVLLRIAQREPARAGLLGARPATLAEIRQALEPDEALLQYLVTPERLLVFAVTRAGLTPFEVVISAAQLENRVRLARALVATPAANDSGRLVLQELHRVLVTPVERAPNFGDVRRLVIVPHGILSYLPFATLRHPTSGRRLVEDRSLQLLPTAAALPALRRGAMEESPQRGTSVFAPFPDELPATREEAKVVAAAVPGARGVTGQPATEYALRRALAAGEVVHVATHGIMNPINPMFSSVRLTRGTTGAADDDGRLEVHELIGMRSASPLVFLSGCETGLGGARTTPFDRHEDYATLAQAFLYSGARSVVATLWRIDDEGSARFAERFYRHLGTLSAPEALAAAQRDLMSDARWAHPYYWAGYTIAGDGPRTAGANRTARAVSP